MSILLIAPDWRPDDWLAALEAAGPGRTIRVHGIDEYDPATVRYALTWKPPPGLLASLPNLQAIFNLGAGVDALLATPDLPDVPIVRLVDDDLTARMSEWVTLQVLVHHRRLLAYQRQQARSEWRELPQPVASEVRVGIMGYGVLGADAAGVLARLGFRVSAWSRSAKPGATVPVVVGEERLPAFLAVTDILVVLLPLTRATCGILDRMLFARLARDGPLGGPVLINAGRGGLQVEADILAALEDGTLAGASLDVFETEPLPAESPLWGASNLVITPHNAAESEPSAVAGYVMMQIARHERGEPLDNLVDRARGY